MSRNITIQNKRSEVTVTHAPTGISASCDSDRSQHRNKQKAWSLLKARLWAALHLSKPSAVVASYVLPENVTYPDDLGEHKRLRGDVTSVAIPAEADFSNHRATWGRTRDGMSDGKDAA